MDFALIERIDNGEICYKLLKTNFYRNCFVIIAQSKTDFYCGSIKADRKSARALFENIAESATEPHTLCDILRDFELQKV